MAYAFNADKSKYEFDLDVFLLTVYPVGAIYMSANETNPGELFGGTWEAWGSGRVPVGVNANDNNFRSVEQTGGAATHTHTNPTTGSTALTTAQIPAHGHGYTMNAGNYNFVQASSSGIAAADFTTRSATTDNAGSGQGHTHTMGSTGSASTLQPYITCYMWKRTA